jgi:diguanylate cyclase (GGDEF)-like protein/PAS domain S-box-containing protein
MAVVAVRGEGSGAIVAANEALAELTGYPLSELEGMAYEDLLLAEDVEGDRRLMRELVRGRELRHQIELRLRDAKGRTRWTLASGALVGASKAVEREAIREFQDIDERKVVESRLEFLADHDPLTGLFNRRRFTRELSAAVTRARRDREVGAVFVIDLDHLKEVNDKFGHATGDEVLRTVGQLLSERLRETDVVARIGGDEFAVLVPRTRGEEVAPLANDLLRVVEKAGTRVPSPGFGLSASVGVTLLRAGGEDTGPDVLMDADEAMYAAKGAGRGRFTVQRKERERTRPTQAKQTWSGRIRRALESDQFVLVCQPIVSLANSGVAGYELLLRMHGELGGLLLPESFMYSAERFGLAQEIDRWVLGRALELMRRRPGVSIAVNVSAESLVDATVTDFLGARVDRLAVDPSALTIEVTETAAISDMDEARRFVGRLRELGCRVALDDFGAGFGSFFYLKYLRPDYLKIDGEFVRSLPGSPVDLALVAGMVETARRLGIKTIAEFVGDQETVTALREAGVDYAQGNYIGRPAPISEAMGGTEPETTLLDNGHR